MTQAEFNLYMQTNSTRRPSRSGAGFSWTGRGFPLSTRGAACLFGLVLCLGVGSSLLMLQNVNHGMPAVGETVMMAQDTARSQG